MAAITKSIIYSLIDTASYELIHISHNFRTGLALLPDFNFKKIQNASPSALNSSDIVGGWGSALGSAG